MVPTSTPIVLPDLDAPDEGLRVSCWLIDLGDAVEEGDRVVEVLMPGMTFDVSAPVSGILSCIDKEATASIIVGDVLGWIESASTEDAT